MSDDPRDVLLLTADEGRAALIARLTAGDEGGVRITRATTVDEGLERLARRSYDVLIVEDRLGAATALDVLRAVSARDVPTPVVVVTTAGDEAFAVHCMRAGAADCLPVAGLSEAALRDALRLALADRRAEARRRRAEAELLASEARYRLLFERSTAGIFRTLRDGTVLECNGAFARILGYPSSEALRGTNAAAFFADPDERARLLERLTSAHALENLDVVFRRADGTAIDVLLTMQEITDAPAGNYLEGHIVDVTALRRAEAAERETERLRDVARLASSAAHEINNPLAIILASIDLLQRRADLDESLRAAAARTAEAGRRISDIVGRMRHLEPPASWPGPEGASDLRRASEEPP